MPVAIVISRPEHKHRITFTTEDSLENVFCWQISDRLSTVLAEFRHSSRNGVFSNPDEDIQLPGLSLRQLRVLYSQHGDNPARALVRFAAISGNPHRALKSEDGFSNPLEALTSQVYRDALDWVLLPAVNIATLNEMSVFSEPNDSAVRTSLQNLQISKDRLLFQIELVKRELNRLERRAYSQQTENKPLVAAEPEQTEFRTMRALRKMGSYGAP